MRSNEGEVKKMKEAYRVGEKWEGLGYGGGF